MERAVDWLIFIKKSYSIFLPSQKQMSGNFEVNYKNMQNQNQAQTSFSWKSASKFIQFAFEEGGHRPFSREDEDEQNLENGSPPKTSKPSEHESEDSEESYEPSNQVIDFEKTGEENQQLQITNSGKVIVDEINQICAFVSKGQLPTITVNLKHDSKSGLEGQGNSQKPTYLELFLAEKSHSNQYEKYKIIRDGLTGVVRYRLKKQSSIKFQKNRFNYWPTPDKMPRLILVLYQQSDNRRVYKSVMISDEFTIIDNHKVLAIDGPQALKLYFQLMVPGFLDKTGTIQNQKINLSNKHKIIQQMGTFENYLIKKNKKIWNVVYAAYKYSHLADLFFYNPENKPKRQQFLQLWKQVIESFKSQENPENQKTCNYLHPAAKFVFKINFPLRTVRFIINKEYTKYLSIIATQNQFDTAGKWTKFDEVTELKDAYIVCYNEVQAKLISEPLVSKTTTIQTPQQQSPPQQTQKKSAHHNSKNDDEDFNEEDVEDQEDDIEYDGDSSENYSMSNKKRGRKGGQKKSQDAKKNGNNGFRQNKYSTRGGNRTRNKQDTEDSNDKKVNMIKKNKEKESVNRPNPQGTHVPNPPFRVLTPTQAGQYKDQQTQAIDPSKMFGMIPMGINPAMMMGVKKTEDIKGLQGLQGIPGMPKGIGMPMMIPGGMNPQMIPMMGGSLPPGAQVIQMGNGMQAIMMPVQMDKNQQATQTNGMPNIAALGGMGAMGGMGSMSGMLPMMMGGGTGMPQGFMIPTGMMGQNLQAQSADKSKTAQNDKQKQGEKKQEKKDTFPPQAMQAVDLSKMGMLGQMPGGIGVLPTGQLGMQVPQLMQMGIPGLNPTMMASGTGIPQGFMMNPMMQMTKPNTENKEQGANKSTTPAMQNPLFGGTMPFMMASMPNQLSTENSSQNSSPNLQGMQLGMMGQFPQMMQMPQGAQMQGAQGQGGMPMGFMMLNQEQLRQMSPAQQMQMMMSKGMMPGMMQMPKSDNNDPNKK